jgi:predicted RNA-binding Zn-ribbon protein involved in translation (DUF1610 family)
MSILKLLALDQSSDQDCPDCGHQAYIVRVQDLSRQVDGEAFLPTVCTTCGWANGNLEVYEYSQEEKDAFIQEVREWVRRFEAPFHNFINSLDDDLKKMLEGKASTAGMTPAELLRKLIIEYQPKTLEKEKPGLTASDVVRVIVENIDLFNEFYNSHHSRE